MSALIAVAPALPLHTAGKYVAGAYIVFIALILIYVTIMAVRLSHNQRELAELKREMEADRLGAGADRPGSDQPFENRPGGGSPDMTADALERESV